MKALGWIWVLLAAIPALAQPDFYQKEQPKPVGRRYVITLQDGSQLVGELVRQDTLEAVIKTSNLGQVTLRADQIVSMVLVTAGKTQVAYPNLFPQYLYFSPTAFSAERKKLYFRNSIGYYSQFDYGITDNWSVGAGFFTFLPSILFSVGTKVSVPVSKTIRLGVQGQYIGGYITDGLNYGVTLVQGIATIGTAERNVTLGVGTSFNRGQFSNGKLLTIGFVRKVSPAITFISENHILVANDSNTKQSFSLSGGVRFDRRRHSFDVALNGFYSNTPGANFLIIPFASYQLRIGP